MAPERDSLTTWNDALIALQLLQLTPHGLGGVCLRAPHGPVRERWLAELARLGLPLVKVPATVDMERLLGGMDLTLTLQTGRLQLQPGLLQQADQGLACVPMAERFPAALVAPLVQVMDAQQVHSAQQGVVPQASAARLGVVALDESLPDEPGVHPSLRERLGIWLDLEALAPSGILDLQPEDPGERPAVRLEDTCCADARARLPQVTWTDAQLEALCAAALGLGITSLRVPSLALRVASGHAALHGRVALGDDDLAYAARCVLAPRATQWPAEPAVEEQDQTPAAEEPAAPPQDVGESEPASDEHTESQDPASPAPSAEDLQEMLVAAALASLPPHVLDALMSGAGSQRGRTSGRSGQVRAGQQRGRPLPPRPGRPGGHARLHLLATLRAAAPRQRLRQRADASQRVAIRVEDFHVQRYQQRAASCVILALDASGSAALQRLAEAKGAVELLLQQSYARRDSVCIVAFRGAQAQLLLPMTRSLVRAKRAMSGLPGGGGTPLALALKLAHEQADLLQRQGVTPLLVVLSDGRANVDLRGLGGRAQARSDALDWGRLWRLSGHRALWIDTSLEPDPQARELAASMEAAYLPMPQVQAQRMAQAMQSLRSAQA
ncbi:MAG: magnesium chelatase subunit D [Hylemonella sp.]|uniref:magnesium chelatase subunit D n=1 Tax=Hylemonella sp. TaxID=2066020 RepID=UPI0022BC1C86|nr:magnesium chelatase subunit D [Hylemonella sp.]MCZ8253831.1 magnesium chelatase subunit D [Hylemonella sp.]